MILDCNFQIKDATMSIMALINDNEDPRIKEKVRYHIKLSHLIPCLFCILDVITNENYIIYS